MSPHHRPLGWILLLLVTACTSSGPQLTPESLAVSRILDREAAADRFSGTALIAHGDRLLLRRGYGVANAATDTPCTADTMLPIASLTKVFTQVAILRLAEAGRLDLDDRLAEHRPDLDPEIGRRITLRQLLAMTSGLPRELDDDPRRSGVRFDDNGLAGPFLDRLEDLELTTEPGTAAAYSNLGYWLLGAVIEATTGTTYAEALADLVWRPLALTGTLFGQPEGEGRGHLRADDGGLLAVDDRGVGRRYASGALASTVDDLHTLCRALQDGSLLPRDAALQMAAGFSDRPPPGPPTVVATGHQPGIVTFLACRLDDPDSIILLANRAIQPPQRIGRIAREIAHAMSP